MNFNTGIGFDLNNFHILNDILNNNILPFVSNKSEIISNLIEKAKEEAKKLADKKFNQEKNTNKNTKKMSIKELKRLTNQDKIKRRQNKNNLSARKCVFIRKKYQELLEKYLKELAEKNMELEKRILELEKRNKELEQEKNIDQLLY